MGRSVLTQGDLIPGFRNGYRSFFQFKLNRGETGASVTEDYLRDWLRTRRGGVDSVALDSWDGESDVVLPSGAKVESVRFHDERSQQAAVRYRVTDAADEGQYRVSVSALTDRRQSEDVGFLVEVGRDSDTGDDAVKSTHPPRIVPNILDSREVVDGATRLEGGPRVVQVGDVDELLQAIADQDREVPLLVAVSPGPEADERWREIIRQMTRTAVGTAAIYTVAANAAEELNSRLASSLQVHPGHLRFVSPRVNVDAPVKRRHPLWKPDGLAAALDDTGSPTEDAVAEMADWPRRHLLQAPLPPRLRRMAQLLAQAERRKDLDEVVEEKVADALGEAPEKPVVAAAVDQVAKVKALFPKRRELHSSESTGDFWPTFSTLLAKWLDKPVEEINQSAVEDDLKELDIRIMKDRESAATNEDYLTRVERERDDLQVEIAELREENDSLLVQLEVAQKEQTALEKTAAAMRGQLEELQIEAATVPEDSGVTSEGLSELQFKLSQVGDLEEPDVEVRRALKLMAGRLDPILQQKLEPYLQGLEWPAVLRQLDLAKGRTAGTYERHDPAAQLRMLTEPLGQLGYHFEVDGNRRVSAEAQQLRNMRNLWAHNMELGEWDVARTYGFVYELLTALGDEEGAQEAQEHLDRVLLHYSLGSSIEVLQNVRDETLAKEDAASETAIGRAETEEAVQPSESVMVRADAEDTPLVGAARLSYVPWETSGAGSLEPLDELWRAENRELVRSVVEEIVSFEGPIYLSRLISLVGAEFGLQRVKGSRRTDIEEQVRATEVTVDAEGFVWPRDVDPKSWAEFRPSGSDVPREFDEISPVEIRNAARFILAEDPGLVGESLDREIMQTFGKSRRTAGLRKHLKRSLGANAEKVRETVPKDPEDSPSD